MNFKTLLKFCLIHIFVLAILLFITFSAKESGDMNVVIFETFMYLPYVIFLSVINIIILTIGTNYQRINSIKWLSAIFTTFILLIWYLIKGGYIEIIHWKVSLIEFLIINLIVLIINFLTVYIVMRNKNIST